MTYVEFAVIRRHIGAILRKANVSLSMLTIADIVSEGVKIDPDAYKRPPFPSLPLRRSPLVERVISEAELTQYLDA